MRVSFIKHLPISQKMYEKSDNFWLLTALRWYDFIKCKKLTSTTMRGTMLSAQLFIFKFMIRYFLIDINVKFYSAALELKKKILNNPSLIIFT